MSESKLSWPGPSPQNLDNKDWTVLRAKVAVSDYRRLKEVAEDLTEREGRRVYMSELVRRAIRSFTRAHNDGKEVLHGTPDALIFIHEDR